MYDTQAIFILFFMKKKRSSENEIFLSVPILTFCFRYNKSLFPRETVLRKGP